MYKETGIFLAHISRQKPIWKDGELWTSILIAAAMGIWMRHNTLIISGVKEQLSDILTVSSIVFGFVMTTLALYVEVASGWSKEKRVQRVIGKIVDWQVWSVICLIAQIAYTIALRLVDGRVDLKMNCRPIWFAILIFLTVYAGFQILNHTLIIWWAFRDPSKFDISDVSDSGAI